MDGVKLTDRNGGGDGGYPTSSNPLKTLQDGQVGLPSEVDTRATGRSSGTSGLSDSAGDGTSNLSESGEEGSRTNSDKKRPPTEVNTSVRFPGLSGSGTGGSSGLSEDGSGSGSNSALSGGEEEGSDSSHGKKASSKERVARSVSESCESGACQDVQTKVENQQKLEQDAIRFVRNFMIILLQAKPRLSQKEKRSIMLKNEQKRERKRKVNRLSAQRKRIKERELMDRLYDQFKTLSSANEALKTDSDKLKQLLEIIRQISPAVSVGVNDTGMHHPTTLQNSVGPSGLMNHSQTYQDKSVGPLPIASFQEAAWTKQIPQRMSSNQNPQGFAVQNIGQPHGSMQYSSFYDQTQQFLSLTQNLASASTTAASAVANTLLLQQQLHSIMNPDPRCPTPPPQAAIADQLQMFLQSNNSQTSSMAEQNKYQSTILEQIRDILQASVTSQSQQPEQNPSAACMPQDQNNCFINSSQGITLEEHVPQLQFPSTSESNAPSTEPTVSDNDMPIGLQNQLLELLRRTISSTPTTNQEQQQESTPSLTAPQAMAALQALLRHVQTDNSSGAQPMDST